MSGSNVWLDLHPQVVPDLGVRLISKPNSKEFRHLLSIVMNNTPMATMDDAEQGMWLALAIKEAENSNI